MALLFDSWLVELGSVIIALLAGVYFYLTRIFQYWKIKGLPYLKPTFPFGNLKDTMLQRQSMGEAFTSMYWQLEGHKIGGIYQINTPALLVRDPELIKTVLTKDFKNFYDHGMYFDEQNDPLSANLFLLEGKRWKHLRYKLTPTFSSGKMKMMFPTLVECVNELKAYLAPFAERKNTIEVKDILAKYTTDIISSCAFGIQSNCLKNPDSEFRTMGIRVFETSAFTMFRDILLLLAPKLARVVKIPFAPLDVSRFFIRMVKETIEHREAHNISRNDFMQLLIALKNKKSVHNGDEKEENIDQDKLLEKNVYDVNGMTVDEVAAQAFVFFIGGFETASNVASFCLYELAFNQDIQDRLRAEVDSVLNEYGGHLTFEGIHKMEYMDKILKEVVRKYPPAPMLTRSCTKDYQLPGSDVRIKRGTPVIIPVYGLHHDPQYYPNPEEFDPERFTEEAKSQRHHYVYLPFGEGPRMCIGYRFGWMQIKIAIASFISSYRVNVCKKLTPIPIVMDKKSMFLSPEGGIYLQITERSRV